MVRLQAAQRFPRTARLLNPAAFRQVFAEANRVSDQHLTMLLCPNRLNHARLGLAIARRSVPRAVDRNRIKRAARESFRLRLRNLPAVDVVIMARPDARNLEAAALVHVLDRLWTRLTKRCAVSS